MTESRAPIVQKPPWFCAQRMVRGDVRRWAFKGASFSFVVACPGCGHPSMVTVEEWGLQEGAIVKDRAPMSPKPNTPLSDFEYPATMTSTKQHKCPRCAGELRAVGRELVLTRA